MATFLPEEIVVIILSKLPPKSLLRFRSVSKSWLSLIGSPDFLSKNLLNNSFLTPTPTTQNSHIIINNNIVLSPTLKQIYSYNTLDDCASPTVLKIVGSCNGLVCLLSTTERDIFLWNPTTSAFKQLPPVANSNGYKVNFCFGFDANANDFKVTRIYYAGIPPSVIPNGHNREAEVYSLSSGCWRKLVDVDVPCISSELEWGVEAYLNGVCFWLVVIGNIVAFDVSQEAFKTTPLPDSVLGDRRNSPKNLTVLNESLALIINKKKYLDIWVLFEFGVKESWTRLVTITTLFLSLRRPMGFWRYGELFLENREGHLVLYDPFTQTVRNLQVKGKQKQVFCVGGLRFQLMVHECLQANLQLLE